MKKHILRKIRSGRSQIAGLALAAILAVFPTGEGYGATYNVGSGKSNSNLEALRAKTVLTGGDVIVVYNDDKSLLGSLTTKTYGGAESVTIKSDGQENRTITYAGLKSDQGRLIDMPQGIFRLEGNLTFSQFQNRNDGGVAHVSAYGSLISQGAGFIGNISDKKGGVIYNDNAKAELANGNFSRNTALAGGAFAAMGGISKISSFDIDNNTAHLGGAFHIETGLLTVENSVFHSNRTLADAAPGVDDGHGGALYMKNATVILDRSDFLANEAAGLGGAVYVEGEASLTLNASSGKKLTFLGNRDALGFNAIHFNLDSAAGSSLTQKFVINGDADVVIDDSIRAVKNTGNQSYLVIEKIGSGTWSLGDRNTFDGQKLTTTVDVRGGTLKLDHGAGIEITEGSFLLREGMTLASHGQGLVKVTGNGMQQAITLQTGSRIELNMVSLDGNDNPDLAMLTLDGKAEDPLGNRTVNALSLGSVIVDVTNINAYKQDTAGKGTYVLVQADGADFSGATLLINGENPETATINNDRIGKRTIKMAQNRKDRIILELDGVDINREVTWNGTGGIGTWSETVAAWDVWNSASRSFLNGDDVVFGNAAGLTKNIEVDAAGVSVGTMRVEGNYSFAGGDIHARSLDYARNATVTFDSRKLDFSVNVLNGATVGLVAAKGHELIVTNRFENSAVTAGEGSVFNIGRAKVGGETGTESTIRFTGNANQLDGGGAVQGDTVRLLGGANSFTGNSASGNGGAVSATTIDILGGSASFENNTAQGKGGAIYARGNVTIATADGNVAFRGNRQGTSGEANAIYMENPAANILQLTAASGQGIQFFDPIENAASRGSARDFTVNIDGPGFVQFDKHRSNVRGKTTVSKGTMKLTGGAAYGAQSGNTEFSLKNNAVLEVDAFKNTVTADTIKLDRNSTIRVDLTDADTTGRAAALILDGNVAVAEGNTFNVDALVASQNGVFLLVSAPDTDFAGKVVGTINGDALPENVRNDRYGLREFTFGYGNIFLELKGFDQNRSVTWSGAESNVWSESDANWTVPYTSSRFFLNGDTVTFTDGGMNTAIEVAASGVKVGGMKVGSGNYTFDKGTISKTADGQTLDKYGQGVLTLNQMNVFDRVNVTAGTLAGGNADGTTIVGDLFVGFGAKLSPGTEGPGIFRVDGDVRFQNGSYIYLDLGKTLEKSDRLHATGVIDFSSDMEGIVTVVVAGNGVGKGVAATDEAVIRADGGILLGGEILRDGETAAQNDKITLQRSGNKIVIRSDGTLNLLSAGVSGDGKALAINAVGDYIPTEPGPDFSWNQTAVLASIENAFSPSFANQLMAKVSLLDDDEKRQFLEQLLPTLDSAMPKVTQRAITQHRQVTFERLRNLNVERTSRYERFFDGEARQGTQVRGQRFCSHAAPIIWLQNYGDFMQQKKRTVQGYRSDSYGIAMGTDRWLDTNTVVGLGFGGGFASVRTEDRTQRADAHTFVFTPYVSHTTRDGYKFLASLGYAYNDYEITKHPGGTKIESSHQGNAFLMNFEVSKKLRGLWTDVTPYFGLEMIYLDEEGYLEKDGRGDAVSGVKGRITESYLQTLGLRFGRTRTNRWGWIVNPSVSLGWIHDYGDGSVRTTAGYTGGTPFVIRGSSMNRDRFAVGLNYNAVINQRISLFGGYNAECASRFGAHTIQAGFTFEF